MRDPDWARLGLTGNPFENIVPGEHLEWVDVAPAVRAALAHRPFIVELIGERGAGKSTTLRWYAGHHPDARYVYCAADRAPMLPWDGAAVLCLDEANALRRSVVRELAAEARHRGVSLLVATHVSLARALHPTQSLRLDEHVGLGWVRHRVAAAALPGHTPFDFLAVAEPLLPRVSGVTYALLRVLYELAENLARGLELSAALDDALRRVRDDDTGAPLLRR